MTQPQTQAELWQMIVDVGREAWRKRARAKRLERAPAWSGSPAEPCGIRVVFRAPRVANDNAGPRRG